MDIKQRLRKAIEDYGDFPSSSPELSGICQDALAEIERLESTQLERAWQEFVKRQPYRMFCDSRAAFEAGFGAASSRRLGEDS